MSLGYTGYCKLLSLNGTSATYQYSGENWNDGGKSKSGDSLLLDGTFTIKLSSLKEPEIHEKLKKMPSGRKKMLVKRIPHTVGVCEKYLAGDITIDRECKNAFVRGGTSSVKMDYIALGLLYKIYEGYQITGKLPETMGFTQ